MARSRPVPAAAPGSTRFTPSTPADPRRVDAALQQRPFTPGTSPGGLGRHLTGLGISTLPTLGTAGVSYARNEDLSQAIADATPVATATTGLGLARMMARPAIRHQRQRQGDAAVQDLRTAQTELSDHRQALDAIPRPHEDLSRYLTDSQRGQLELTDRQLAQREASAPPEPTRDRSRLPPTAPQVPTPKDLQNQLDRLNQQIRAEEIKLDAVQRPAQNPIVALFNQATPSMKRGERVDMLRTLHQRVNPNTGHLDTGGLAPDWARHAERAWNHLQHEGIVPRDLRTFQFDPDRPENRPRDIGIDAAAERRLQGNLTLLRERRDHLANEVIPQRTGELQARADAGAQQARTKEQQRRRRIHAEAQQRYDQHQAEIERLRAERNTLTQGAEDARSRDVTASREGLEAALSPEQRAELGRIDAALGGETLPGSTYTPSGAADRQQLQTRREALLENARVIPADDPRLERVEALNAEITRLQDAAARDGRFLRALQLGAPTFMGADIAGRGDDSFSAQRLPGVQEMRQGTKDVVDAIAQGRVDHPGFWTWPRIAGAGVATGLLGLLAHSALNRQRQQRVVDEEEEEEKPVRRRGRPRGTGRPRGRPRKVVA